MTTILAGSRTLGSRELDAALSSYKLPITRVVCGCADGIDKKGYEFARRVKIPVVFFPAWPHQYTWAFFNKKPGELIVYPKGGYKGYVKHLGFQRNTAMATWDEAEALLAVHDCTKTNDSHGTGGTAHMIEEAEKAGLIVTVHRVLR